MYAILMYAKWVITKLTSVYFSHRISYTLTLFIFLTLVEGSQKMGTLAGVWSSWVATLAQTSLLPHGHYYGNNDYYYYRRIAIY